MRRLPSLAASATCSSGSFVESQICGRCGLFENKTTVPQRGAQPRQETEEGRRDDGENVVGCITILLVLIANGDFFLEFEAW